MPRAVNFSAGPDTITPAELNAVQDDYAGIGKCRHVALDMQDMDAVVAQGNFTTLMGRNGTSLSISASVVTLNNPAVVFCVDRAEWDSSDPDNDMILLRSMTMNMRVTMVKNTIGGARTYAFDIVRLGTPVGGTSGNNPTVTLIGGLTDSALTFDAIADASGTSKTATAPCSDVPPGRHLYAVRCTRNGTFTGTNGRISLTGYVEISSE